MSSVGLVMVGSIYNESDWRLPALPSLESLRPIQDLFNIAPAPAGSANTIKSPSFVASSPPRPVMSKVKWAFKIYESTYFCAIIYFMPRKLIIAITLINIGIRFKKKKGNN